jgi:hypothetical protein
MDILLLDAGNTIKFISLVELVLVSLTYTKEDQSCGVVAPEKLP